ncbi:MAG: hypothetical protein AVDCRST_MAG58-2981, partial [uncultured Rubrobacteraceae bacterium]
EGHHLRVLCASGKLNKRPGTPGGHSPQRATLLPRGAELPRPRRGDRSHLGYPREPSTLAPRKGAGKRDHGHKQVRGPHRGAVRDLVGNKPFAHRGRTLHLRI